MLPEQFGVVEHPRADVRYPRSVGELQAWFPTDVDCLDYLEWLRWPAGFVCPGCGHAGGWRLGDGRFECAECQARTSTTAGTIFDRTRTPLTVWFTACWLFASDKGGISALSLQRGLEIGSYQTAWTMLHRLRSVLVRPGRERLTGTVEVDETFIGGAEPGLRGADEGLIDLHRPGQPLPARAHQHRAQPMQHRPRGLVGPDLQPALQTQCRDAPFVAGKQPARREPHRQRRARPVEDRARCSRRAGLAFGALEPAVTEPPAPGVAATRTHEASRPAQPLQVVQAVHIGRKPRLELAHRSRVAHVSARMLHDPKLLRLHG